MTTGTIGNDNLSNDPNVFNEIVDALDGDDIITIVTPNNLANPGPSVTVSGGNGFDTLIVNTAGSFTEIGANNGTFVVRFGPNSRYTVNWSSIERLELTGSLFTNNPFVFGDEIDVLRFTSSTARAVFGTAGGADDVALSGTFISIVIDAGDGNDVIDFRSVTGVLEGINAQGDAGNDVLYASPLTDILFGGDGNDALIFGAHLTSADGAVGGAGTDTLVIQGNYPLLSLDLNVATIEALLVASGSDTRFGDTAGNQ
jgi:hypothetical protein